MKSLSEIKNIEFIYSFQQEGHSDIVSSVSISGDYIVSGSSDKTVKLWSIKEKKLIHTFEGHSDIVSSVSISGDY